MNVGLSDLNLTVKAFTSVNLLDKKHYSYTIEEIEKSAKDGSLAKKKKKIAKREIAPEIIKISMSFLQDTYIPSRERSVYEIKETKYEELNITDEQFAEENAETADLDTKPLIIKGLV